MRRGRHAARGAGRRLGPARRDLPRLRPADARRVPGLDAGPGRRVAGAAATTSRWRSPASTRFAEEANRALRVLDTQRLAVRQLVRDGGEVFNALSERQGQLRGLITNSERGLRDHRRARCRAGTDLPDLPDLPARVADHAHPARPVRPGHRPAGAAAAARGARAQPDADRPRPARAGPGGLLRRPSRDDLGRRPGLPRDAAPALRRPDTAARPTWTPSSPTSTRSSRRSASTAARSRPCWATPAPRHSPRSTTPAPAARSCAPRPRFTRRRWPRAIRGGY